MNTIVQDASPRVYSWAPEHAHLGRQRNNLETRFPPTSWHETTDKRCYDPVGPQVRFRTPGGVWVADNAWGVSHECQASVWGRHGRARRRPHIAPDAHTGARRHVVSGENVSLAQHSPGLAWSDGGPELLGLPLFGLWVLRQKGSSALHVACAVLYRAEQREGVCQ
jgi:hypothetical protein